MHLKNSILKLLLNWFYYYFFLYLSLYLIKRKPKIYEKNNFNCIIKIEKNLLEYIMKIIIIISQ